MVPRKGLDRPTPKTSILLGLSIRPAGGCVPVLRTVGKDLQPRMFAATAQGLIQLSQMVMTPKPRPPSVEIPGLAWSGELPFELKVAIAEAVTLFSRIDDMVIRVLWAGEMADLKRRKQTMKNRSFTNLEYLEAFVKAHLGGIEIPETWASLAALRQERNMIAHGVWGMSEGVPTVIWHEKMLESDEFETAELYDYERFKVFTDKAMKLLDTFARYRVMLNQIAEIKRREAAETAPPSGSPPVQPPADGDADPPQQ
jgi:hypothetical protein